MARKKAQPESKKAGESTLDAINDILGATTSSEFEAKTLSTGYEPLNKICSGKYKDGGFPVGRIIEMYGPPSCGKTAISTLLMKECINSGGFAMFMDHERSFDINLARRLGLNDRSGKFAHVRPTSFEESFFRATKTARAIRDQELIPADAPIVAVFDSLAMMVPKSKLTKDMTETTMADALALAKATSQTLPTVKMLAEETNMMVLILNQLREDPTVIHGDKSRTPGGKTPAFVSDLRIALKAKKLYDKDKNVTGQRITATCTKSKLTTPFKSCEWDFLFVGMGKFDMVGGLIEEAVKINAIERNGAYTIWDGKSYHKAKLSTFIETSPQELEKLKQLIIDTESGDADVE